MVIPSMRRNRALPGVVGSAPQAGGIAKTEGTMQAASIAILAGLKVGFIDADSTTAATSMIVGRSGYSVMKMDGEPDFADRAQSMFAQHDLVFVDFGAAQLSSPETMLPMLSLMDRFGGRDNCALILNQIPHKTGLSADLARIGGFFAPRVQLRIGRHNIDGSGQFADLPSALQRLPLHHVEQIAPALCDLWRERGILHADLINSPPPGYERATAKVAQHLFHIADSNGFAEWLGAADALPVLRTAAQGALRYVPREPAAVLTNDVIARYNDVNDALAALRHAASDADCIMGARDYQAADRAYRVAVTTARAAT